MKPLLARIADWSPAPALTPRFLALAPSEQSQHVSCEVNVLNDKIDMPNQDIWDKIKKMKATAPASAGPHYQSTLDAIGRMRAALNFAPL